MTDRDRLIELLNDLNVWDDYISNEDIADHLIANGVTVGSSPCDLCRYNPPSSGDGKLCSMCPACAKEVE